MLMVNGIDFPKNADVLEPNRVTKIHVSLRIDPDVVEWFKSGGKNWQTHMNNVLRSYIRTKSNT